MSQVYIEANYTGRVLHASRVIRSGGEADRVFDTCFEMYDGDAVAVALYRISRGDDALRRNIWRYISRHSVVPLAFSHRRLNEDQLAGWAAKLREPMKEAS